MIKIKRSNLQNLCNADFANRSDDYEEIVTKILDKSGFIQDYKCLSVRILMNNLKGKTLTRSNSVSEFKFKRALMLAHVLNSCIDRKVSAGFLNTLERDKSQLQYTRSEINLKIINISRNSSLDKIEYIKKIREAILIYENSSEEE